MVAVQRHVVLKDVRVMRKRKLTRLVLLPLVVCVTVAVAALMAAVVLFSPWLSPLGSVHDNDGDGWPDDYDVAPDDPLNWASGGALVVVTISSEHTLSGYQYTVRVDGAVMANGDIDPGQTIIENVEVRFLIGRSMEKQVVVTMTCTDGSVGQKELVLYSGRSYGASFFIPG